MKKNLLFFIILSCLISISAIAAEKKYLEDSKKTHYITAGVSFSSSFTPKKYNKVLGLSSSISLHPKKMYSLKNATVTRYEQKYHNIRLNGKYQGLKTSSKYGTIGRKQG